jgi:regulator of replication initiation timing
MAASSMEDFVSRAERAEKEIENLLSEIRNLEKCSNGAPEVEEIPEELEKLQLENKKLKYRLGILHRAVEMASTAKKVKTSTGLDEKSTMPSIAQVPVAKLFRLSLALG